MKKVIPYIIYLLFAILFFIFPDAISKYIPRSLLYVLGGISLLIVITFYYLARIKKSKTKSPFN